MSASSVSGVLSLVSLVLSMGDCLFRKLGTVLWIARQRKVARLAPKNSAGKSYPLGSDALLFTDLKPCTLQRDYISSHDKVLLANESVDHDEEVSNFKSIA